jgi:cellulose synthase/poly-beta-1,6-N-acetylglucosamine synthase-like glycosyltransferase
MPTVSIIVPCYNEQDTIGLLLSAIYSQTYPRSKMDVVVSDGMSTDGTREEIEKYQEEYHDLNIQIVDNPKRNIPSALNRALEIAKGDIIIRLDAHSVPEDDYVKRCVNALQEGKGDNVGGVWIIRTKGKGLLARSIMVAASHPLGVGGAQYRIGGTAQAVDTVPFGAFYRNLIRQVGMFDENLLSNEDYEFNARVRQAGGTIWFDPEIKSTYFARSSIPALAKQYWRYGYWKFRMLKRYPGTLRWRQALPPLFVASLVFFSLLGLFNPSFLWFFLAQIGLYLIVLLISGLVVAIKDQDLGLVISVPMAIVVMHFSWGLAFIWSLIASLFNRDSTRV